MNPERKSRQSDWSRPKEEAEQASPKTEREKKSAIYDREFYDLPADATDEELAEAKRVSSERYMEKVKAAQEALKNIEEL